jgi:hypothetical protein
VLLLVSWSACSHARRARAPEREGRMRDEG